MPTVREVCRHVRSKNAGPYWVTVDLFFDGHENFRKYGASASLGAGLFHRLYGVDPAQVRHFPVPDLDMLKISYPRASPQGGEVERDLHAGQQFVRLMDVELDEAVK